MCVPENEVYYVSTSNAIDTNPCTRTAPCATLQHAASRTSAMAENIVVLPGSYSDNHLTASSSMVSAPRVVVHATGAQFSDMFGESSQFTGGDIELVVIGGYFSTSNGVAIYCGSAPCTISRVKVQRGSGVYCGGMTRMFDSDIDVVSDGVTVAGGTCHIERSTVRGSRPINTSAAGTFEMINSVVSGGTGTAVDLPGSVGTIRFSTISASGNTGAKPRGLNCSQGLTISESIVWTPSTTQLPISGGCTVASSLAGPVAVGGAMNLDPQFKSLSDFHLSTSSPAKDFVQTGPADDIDGDARPKGASWDIGADEAD
jgi:hypothetical protein